MTELVIPDHLNIPEVNDYLQKVGWYLFESGYKHDSCRIVAWNTAQLLVTRGVRSTIEDLTIDNYKTKRKLLPLPFKGDLLWPWHTICIEEEVVFDPLVQRPMYYKPYIVHLFNVPVHRKVDSDLDEVVDFLRTTWGT